MGDDPENDDDQVWQDAIKGTKRLPENHKRPDFRPRLLFSRRDQGRDRDFSPATVLPSGRKGSEVDRRTEERLRRGEMELEGRIDLHGLTQDRAHRALEEFMRDGYAQGRRCVLVITGKGQVGTGNNEDGWYEPRSGVLRDRVPEWLRQDSMAPLVLRVYPAQQRHGGEGAFYVLLRRNRS